MLTWSFVKAWLQDHLGSGQVVCSVDQAWNVNFMMDRLLDHHTLASCLSKLMNKPSKLPVPVISGKTRLRVSRKNQGQGLHAETLECFDLCVKNIKQRIHSFHPIILSSLPSFLPHKTHLSAHNTHTHTVITPHNVPIQPMDPLPRSTVQTPNFHIFGFGPAQTEIRMGGMAIWGEPYEYK